MSTGTIDGRYPAWERVAFAVAAMLFLVSVATPAVAWDWLFDTAFLVAGGYVALNSARPAGAVPGGTRTAGVPLLSTYLFLDSALQMLIGFCFPGAVLPVYILLTGLYGAALAARLRERGTPVAGLPWARAFRPPASYLTGAVLVALGCLYLPMLRVYTSTDFWVPPWLTVWMKGQAAAVHPPTLIRSGFSVTYRGFEITFGRLARLLLAGVGVAQLLRLRAPVPAAGPLRFMRVAAVVTGLWWLLVARGYRSLDEPADLLFVAALGVLLVLLFREPAVA